MTGPTVIVSAGSYHLPFNRLVDWMEPWVLRHPEVQVIMQHGPSRPLPGAENHRTLPYQRLLAICADATAIVLQGGAGGVMDMRALRRIPIVVPRIPVDDEVVDDHQLLFTERIADTGAIYRVLEREQLWRYLDLAISGALTTEAPRPDPTAGVQNVFAALSELPPAISGIKRLGRLARAVVGRGRRS